jgi:hypothetical protein
MESTLSHSNHSSPVAGDLDVRHPRAARHTASKAITISYWVVTALFCL